VEVSVGRQLRRVKRGGGTVATPERDRHIRDDVPALGRRHHASAPARTKGLVMREGARLAAIGVGLGLGGALLFPRAVRGLLDGIGPTVPATFLAVPVLLAGVAPVATRVPAARATRVDPVVAMRAD
jgi:hypothetical protein